MNAKRIKRILTARRESARKRLADQMRIWESDFDRAKDALAHDRTVGIGFIQHATTFAESAGEYNAFTEALELIQAEEEIEKGGT